VILNPAAPKYLPDAFIQVALCTVRCYAFNVMCGRFDLHSTLEMIAKIFQIDSIDFDIKQSYNVAPSQDVAIIVNDGKNRLTISKWGFVPCWSKELKTGYNMINDRSETVATNKSLK
jgi:putative SOS response-associated peptidase YedK